MVAEGRLKLRKGAVHFLDECILADGVQVVIIGATGSSAEEGVLPAVFESIGPLRAAGQGLTLADFRAELEDLREGIAHVGAQPEHLWDTSTGCCGLYGGQSKLTLSGNGQGELKLSGNWNQCEPLLRGSPSPATGRWMAGAYARPLFCSTLFVGYTRPLSSLT